MEINLETKTVPHWRKEYKKKASVPFLVVSRDSVEQNSGSGMSNKLYLNGRNSFIVDVIK